MRAILVLLMALGFCAPPALADTLPAAVIADPAPDKDHPARFVPFALPSHGVNVNAVIYLPGGAGPNPTSILLHGLPGVEDNADLAQAIRRAGWNVILLHYRGSWGSPGRFTLAHCLEDAQAAIAWLRDPKTAARLPVDPSRIVVMGHSMGGWAAGYAAAHDPKILAAGLISAGNFGGTFAAVPLKDAATALDENVLLKDGMRVLGDATAMSLARELRKQGAGWDLRNFAAQLAALPVLMVTAEDGVRPYDDAVTAAITAQPGAKVTTVHLDTNHGYNDRRIALAAAVVGWLDTLPGAPH